MFFKKNVFMVLIPFFCIFSCSLFSMNEPSPSPLKTVVEDLQTKLKKLKSKLNPTSSEEPKGGANNLEINSFEELEKFVKNKDASSIENVKSLQLCLQNYKHEYTPLGCMFLNEEEEREKKELLQDISKKITDCLDIFNGEIETLSIDLSSTYIECECFINICNAIGKNTALKSLSIYLKDNGFQWNINGNNTKETSQSMNAMIKNLCNLEKLVINFSSSHHISCALEGVLNNLNMEGCKEITDGINNLKKLEILDLNFYGCTYFTIYVDKQESYTHFDKMVKNILSVSKLKKLSFSLPVIFCVSKSLPNNYIDRILASIFKLFRLLDLTSLRLNFPEDFFNKRLHRDKLIENLFKLNGLIFLRIGKIEIKTDKNLKFDDFIGNYIQKIREEYRKCFLKKKYSSKPLEFRKEKIKEIMDFLYPS
jgi:hypothetical protein